MKKLEDVKKGLECHINGMCDSRCPYFAIKGGCGPHMNPDALTYIQQLESKLKQAVEDIRMLGRTGEFICPVCAHYNHGEGTKGECVKCLTGDGFEWRGSRD